jgi:plastocyanin
MQLVYNLPIPLGEPHYAQVIEAGRIDAIDHYTPVGFNPVRRAKDASAVEGGKERVERRGNEVDVYMTQVRSHFTPDTIRVKEGDLVRLHVTNLEQARDATHGFGISSYDISMSLEPGEHANATFVADKPGVFPFYCLEFCSALHLEMAGYLIVEPAGTKAAEAPQRPSGRGLADAAAAIGRCGARTRDLGCGGVRAAPGRGRAVARTTGGVSRGPGRNGVAGRARCRRAALQSVPGSGRVRGAAAPGPRPDTLGSARRRDPIERRGDDGAARG